MATKIKLRDIISIQKSYSALLDQSFLPAKIKYSLSKDGKRITEEIEEVTNQRNNLILKFGVKGKDGSTSIAPNTPEMESFQLEYNELLDDIELDLITDKIDIELFFKDGVDCTLSARDFLLLDWLIGEKEKEVIKDDNK